MEVTVNTYQVDSTRCENYRSDGFVKLDGVFSPHQVRLYERAISAAIEQKHDLNTETPPNSDSTAYEQAFLQVMNLWRRSEAVRAMVFNETLAQIAADLMGVAGVRLYHDQALYKRAGGGKTPWHCDQYYWPLEGDDTTTVWIPLQDTSLEMGALTFSAGSHLLDLGRHLPIGEDSEAIISKRLATMQLAQVENAFEAGDVSFHSGWTFHRARRNTTDSPRRAMTIIYMADGTRLKKPENDNQMADWQQWCPGAKVGEVVQTPLNPLLC